MHCPVCGQRVAVVWWLSWTFPTQLARDESIPPSWPEGVYGWITGSCDFTEAAMSDTRERTIYCARVEAATRADAVEKIEAMYRGVKHSKPSRWNLRWRFGPDAKPDGWWPEPSRFPRGAA
jgi:hypothetical protein